MPRLLCGRLPAAAGCCRLLSAACRCLCCRCLYRHLLPAADGLSGAPPRTGTAQVAALLGPKTEADLVKPEKKKPAKPAKPAAAAAAADGGAKAAAGKGGKGEEEAEAWRTADPYAFLPKPQENNMVHTSVHFRRAGEGWGQWSCGKVAEGRLAAAAAAAGGAGLLLLLRACGQLPPLPPTTSLHRRAAGGLQRSAPTPGPR